MKDPKDPKDMTTEELESAEAHLTDGMQCQDFMPEYRRVVSLRRRDVREELARRRPEAMPRDTPPDHAHKLIDALNADAPTGKVVHGALQAAIMAQANDMGRDTPASVVRPSMGGYTPGPWEIEQPMDFELAIVQAGKQAYEWEFIACIPLDHDDGLPKDQIRANARLIAQAPAYASAVQDLFDAGDARDEDKFRRTLGRLEAIHRAATGQPPTAL